MSGYNKAVWNNLWDRNSTAHIDKTGIGLGTVWSLTPNATYENCGEAIVKFKARKVDGEHWDPLLRVNGLNLPDARHKRGLWDKVRGAHFKSQLIKAKPGLKKKEMTNELRDHTLKFNLPSAVVVGMQRYNRVLLYEEATLHSASNKEGRTELLRLEGRKSRP